MDTDSLHESSKRFRLSNENFAQERISAVKNEIRKLREAQSEVLSFCMFGSLTTGRSKIGSDIDGYLLVDAVEAAQKRGIVPEKITLTTTDEYGSIETTFANSIAHEYVGPLKEKLKQDLSLQDEQVKHIRSLPVSREIIDSHVENLRLRVEALVEYEEKYKQYEANWYHGESPERPQFPLPSTTLKAMFHLDVGGGIGKYRQYLINKLSQMGDIGESIWKNIIEVGTEMMEQHLRTQTDVLYPRTLTEARVMYVHTDNRQNMNRVRNNV